MDIDKQISIISTILGPKKGEKNHTSSRKNPKSVCRHDWSIQDEELAVRLYKANASSEQIKDAIKDRGMSFQSMMMRLGNLKYLDTGKGLKNVGYNTKIVWERLK
jgi:hypothetical protein